MQPCFLPFIAAMPLGVLCLATREDCVSVFQPSHCVPVPESRVELIERACYLLKSLCRRFLEHFSLGCHTTLLMHISASFLAPPSVARINRTGVLCSLFYRCFDGCGLTPSS